MVNPESPRPGPEQNPLSEVERAKVEELIFTYGSRIIDTLRPQVRKGLGREVVGSVAGRPEDEELTIDTLGEKLLREMIEETDITAVVLSEHNDFNLDQMGNARIIFALDPFDNTSQYKRGLDTSPYSVLGAFDAQGNHIGGIAVDIKDRKAYYAFSDRVYSFDYEDTEREELFKSERESLLEEDSTLAAYLGSNEYSLNFLRYFEPMLEKMHSKAVLYAGGGAYIYALLASGAVDAYVMFDEPRGEIDPGLPLALATGCKVVSVDPETGSYEDYKFDPAQNNADVPFFIAAANEELVKEVVENYILVRSSESSS